MRMEELRESYPEAASYIEKAVDDHSERWVLDNYNKVMQLGVMMPVPDKEELPFFDPAKHETMSDEEQAQMARAYSRYLENVRSGTKPGDSKYSDDQ